MLLLNSVRARSPTMNAYPWIGIHKQRVRRTPHYAQTGANRQQFTDVSNTCWLVAMFPVAELVRLLPGDSRAVMERVPDGSWILDCAVRACSGPLGFPYRTSMPWLAAPQVARPRLGPQALHLDLQVCRRHYWQLPRKAHPESGPAAGSALDWLCVLITCAHQPGRGIGSSPRRVWGGTGEDAGLVGGAVRMS